MLHIIVLVLLLELIEGTGLFGHCSKGCDCTIDSAKCDTIDFEDFGMDVVSLEIISPELPLHLTGESFDVKGLTSLHSLTIINARIIKMDGSSFDELNQFETLIIVGSKIDSLNQPFIIWNIREFMILDSGLSKFEYVSSWSLQTIDLSGNELKIITKYSFNDIPYLVYLNLANNLISVISSYAFSNLTYLHTLNISSNKISFLDPDILKNNHELWALDLSNNPIKILKINIYSTLFSKLDLRSLNLEKFDMGGSPNLCSSLTLYLSNNNVKLTKSSFSNMTTLEYIDLSNNNLESLDSETFKLNKEISHIILDNNNFTILPNFVSAFDKFHSMSEFRCKNCNLTTIPNDAFEIFINLQRLDLSQNQLNLEEYWLNNLSNLFELNLSHNKIKNLNKLQFANLTNLYILNLSHNPISTINTIFFTKTAVRLLDLSSCNLVQFWSIPIERDLHSLLIINIANNSIKSIRKSQLKATRFIKVLNLTNNPLSCDDNLRDSINWLNLHDVSPEISSEETLEFIKYTDFQLFFTSSVWNWKNLAKEVCSRDYYENNFEDFDPEKMKKRRVQEKKHKVFVLFLIFIFSTFIVWVIFVDGTLLKWLNSKICRNSKKKKHGGHLFHRLSEEET